MEMRPVTPDASAQPGELSPADGSGARELLRYRSAQGRWVLAAMILGSSVAGIDSTVVAVALPAIGRNLHVGFQDLQWTVMSYTLTLASLILLAGSLSDRWGRRRVFLIGLGWFTLASVLCAAAPGIGWLIAARAVQGIGGALMTPASLAIIEAAFQPDDRTHAIGTWAGFSGVSSAIAPFLGGWLLEAGSWRWIFLINVPVAAAVAWMTQRHVPESRDTSVSGSADWPGALAGVAALATITYAIIVLPGGGVSSPRFVAAAVLAVGSSVTFAVTEWRKSHPMLPPAIFRPAQFRAANAVTFVVNGALGGFAFVFIPALEIIAGYSPVVAGSALVPVTVVTLLLSGASGQLAQRIGPRPQLVAGCLLCTVASTLAVRLGPHAGYWTVVLPVALLFGLGLASLLPPLTATAMNSAPDSLAGLASGVNNAVARVAGLLWIAALPPITGLTGAAYTDPAQFQSSFVQISWICAAAFACAAVLSAIFITGPRGLTPAPRPAVVQTPVPHLACPIAFGPRTGTNPQANSGALVTPGPLGSRRGSAGTARPPASAAGRAAVPPGVPGRRALHSRLARWRPRFAPRRMPRSRQSPG
jgi:EmrB/QacA subfamily drug resistance transporter